MRITSWRIVKAKHSAKAFEGQGARLYGGRWNPVGVPVIYTAQSISLALLEILVHLEREELLYQHFVKIPVSFDSSLVQVVKHQHLPEDWDHLPPSLSTQTIGRKWIQTSKFAVLKVPSTIVREEHNYLINPLHADVVKLSIGKIQSFDLDKRLINSLSKNLP
jgi:RES domain-containing protein